MKNIHVLPTDKPSRLYLSDYGKEINLGGYPLTNYTTGQHIYITSNEEIKEGDWFLFPLFKEGYKIKKYNSEKHFAQEPCISLANLKAKKIILTTDQDLIKNRTQAIDDEFLEWFVKNPSCESVRVELHIGSTWETRHLYKIIIPKEEPKQERKDCHCKEPDFDVYKAICKSCGNSIIHLGKKISTADNDIPKQKTLEEVAESYRLSTLHERDSEKLAFIRGAKWQQGKSYSEEDMRKAFIAGGNSQIEEDDAYGSRYLKYMEKWFEQFKKE